MPRGFIKSSQYEALPGSDNRRYHTSPGSYCRDENGRGQNSRRNIARLPQRSFRKGVHIVTVNDYLARRDSEWMGKLYRFLGLSVGLIVHELNNDERRAAYSADITYGTNNEMGFDYLRDNMIAYAEQRVQRGHSFAIVDEVDSILIDEARTPLIISGVGDKSTDLYKIADSFAKPLKGYRKGARLKAERRGGAFRGRRLRS